MLPWSALGLLGQALASPPAEVESAHWSAPLSLVSLNGESLAPDILEGKLVMFVNVASKCGFTPQYEGLQALSKTYAERGLVIVGVPCNQFGNQEPGEPEEIISFCHANYGIDFPLLEKQNVKGDSKSALYAHLVSSEIAAGREVRWNFEKFLVDSNGVVLARYGSKTTPEDPELIGAIERGLAKD
jgi:glutathione peroxidase-family protein